MASAAGQAICSICSVLTTTDALELCAECKRPCCGKCCREPNETISLFSAPQVFCSPCYQKRQEMSGIEGCSLHADRSLDLYCLTCEQQICCDCFLLLTEHKRHTIDTVEAIYRQKLLETVEKFREVPKQLKLIDWDALRQVDENLKIVQEVEQRMLVEVQQLVQERTGPLLSKIAEKKRALMRTKDYVAKMELQKRQTLEQIRELKSSDFLRQQAALNERCDRILKDVEQLQVEPVRWDDIECDLLPTCQLQPIVINVPSDEVSSGTLKRVPIQLIDDCGNQWITIFHIGARSVVLEAYPNWTMEDFNFKIVVEISHLSQMKMIGKYFSFREKLLPTELASLDELKACGLLSTAGDLRLRIGIRPDSIVEENSLLKTLLVDQRKTVGQLRMELAAVKDQNFIQQGDMLRLNCEMKQTKEMYETQLMTMRAEIKNLKQSLVEDRPATPASSVVSVPLSPVETDKQKLICDMKRLQAKLDSMRITMKSMNPYAIGSFEIYRCSKESKFYSPHLTSYNGITIYVIVQPNFSSEKSPGVNAYICYAKGPKKKCEVFLEVVNEFEEECVRQDRVFDFSKGTSFTWTNIISHYDLARDGGFLVNDHLKIKFGLRPLLE